jgi:hypothetical protein
MINLKYFTHHAYISSFLFNSLHFSHVLDCLLKFFMLLSPFTLFWKFLVVFKASVFNLLHLLLNFIFHFWRNYFFSFAYSLMLLNSIFSKFSLTFLARNELYIIIIFNIFKRKWAFSNSIFFNWLTIKIILIVWLLFLKRLSFLLNFYILNLFYVFQTASLMDYQRIREKSNI